MKFFKSSAFWTILIGFLLTFILWYIQMWTDPSLEKIPLPFPFGNDDISKSFYSTKLWPNKIQIAIIVGILLLIVQLIIGLHPKISRNKLWIKKMLNHILNEKLNYDLEHTRITVFRIKKGYTFLLPYIYNCFVANLLTHYKKGLLKSHFRITPHPFKDYLVMYTRRSNPYENGTSTFFQVAKSDEEVSGIASHSLYIGKPYKIVTKNISNIQLHNKSFEDLTIKQKQQVRAYMDDTKINDYSKLKCFHRLSNQIWANPIHDKNDKDWGVIVVDSDNVEKLIFDDIEEELISYSRIIELSIIHLI